MRQWTTNLSSASGKRLAPDQGVVFRDVDGPSVESNSPYEWKHKFIGDSDAIIIGVKQGRKAGRSGSIRLGLIRPDDGALIEVGSVRAGLLDKDIDYFGGLLAAGLRPVVKVEFLPVRTVGISLVEPETGPDQIRFDKSAQTVRPINWWTYSAGIASP